MRLKTKLLLLFFLLSCASEAQTLLDKQVNLPFPIQSGTVAEFLNELNTIAGITLNYSSEVVKLSKPVQLSGKEKTVEDFLKTILKDQPVRYLEQSGKIFIVANEPVKKKFTINGYITDVHSGERLISTSLFIFNLKQGTTSNVYGFYSLTLDEDSIDLFVTHAGYISQRMNLYLDSDRVINIAMEPNVITNEIVVVNAESKSNAQNRTLPGRINVSSALIKSVPALLGEPDVLKTLQLLPGIQGSNEGLSGLNVRGGSPDQNLVLLDGVPVYNASHAFGLFSIFNPDVVQNVDVLKGGFPASYGGRLSSVIDVHTKEGDKYKLHGEGGLGIIFSKLTLEGPLKKGKSSFLISARRTYLDLVLKGILLTQKRPPDVSAYFGDIITKMNFSVGPKDHVYLSFYTGKDKYSTNITYQIGPDEDSYQKYLYGFSWGNLTGLARWNHEFNNKLFANLTFNYSRFSFNIKENDYSQKSGEPFPHSFYQKYFSSIRDLNLKYDLDYLPSPDHFIKMGLAATLHEYRPGVSQIYQQDNGTIINRKTDQQSVYTGEYDAYAEDDIRLSAKMKANVGIRFTGFSSQNKLFFSVQPRLNWLYRFTNKWSVKASAVKMNQYIHLLTNSNLGLPTDLWVPVTPRVPPQVSYQLSAGLAYNHDKSLELSMELYYKQMKNVIEYGEGKGFGSSYENWEDIVELGKGRAYGAEWLVQKTKGKLTGLFSYTLGWSDRKFSNINEGKTFPFKYDRRHEIKTLLVWKPSERFELSADWIFATGNAISLPVAWFADPYTGRTIDVYTGRNNYRMRPYHRMDIAIKMMKQKKTHLRTWVFGLYNAYNRLNPFFIYKLTRYMGSNIYQSNYSQFSLFPILPSISYQFKF